MHELSIATSLVDIASQKAAEAGSDSVSKVYLKIGVLSCVTRDALEFAFDVATEHTVLEGATLEIEDVPAVVFCPQCEGERRISDSRSMYRACCPECGAPTSEIRQGQELELTALEIQ